jgi:hypothetical protein
MKHWLLAPIILVLISLPFAVIVRNHEKSETDKEKREIDYQSTVRVYSQNLKQGSSRDRVENYFRTSGTTFTQMCCVDGRTADLVKIGKEDRPWYCSESYVYVAFEFDTDDLPWRRDNAGADLLTTVRLYHQLGGCF